MKISLFLSSALLLQAIAASAQRVYSLEECKQLAIENNVKMRNADIDIMAAKEKQKEAFTHYFPRLSAVGGYVNFNKPLVQETIDLTSVGQIASGLGLDISSAGLPSQLPLEYMKNGVVGSVVALQPVFVGGQIVNGNKLAKLGVEVNELKKQLTQDEVELTVEQYYWQIVLCKAKQQTLAMVEKQLACIEQDATAAVEAGVKLRNDLLQVKLKQNEIRAAQKNLANTLSLCQNLLAQYIGRSDADIDADADIDYLSLPQSPLSELAHHASSVSQLTETRLLDMQVKASKLQYKMAVGKNMPTVAVGAGYIYTDMAGKDFNRTMVMATVAVPISDWWGGSHSIRHHKLQLQRAEQERADAQQLLVIRMDNARNAWHNAYEQLTIASESIAQAEENLRINQDTYNAGTSTMSDLLSAQTLMQQTHDKYTEAFIDYQLKALQYKQAVGK